MWFEFESIIDTNEYLGTRQFDDQVQVLRLFNYLLVFN